jgi:hypothetical protein
MNRRHKMRKLIISVIMITALTAVAYSEGFKFNNMPQPEITYDMNKVYGQMQEFTDKFRKEGPTKTPQLIYLFSDSVPAITMENVFAQAKKITSLEFTGCVRGFKGKTDKDLRKFIEHQVEKGKIDNQEVRMDPFFFRDLNVKKVPALVYASCSSQPVNCDYHYIVYGDSRLDYLVEQIYKANPGDKTIQRVLADLRS